MPGGVWSLLPEVLGGPFSCPVPWEGGAAHGALKRTPAVGDHGDQGLGSTLPGGALSTMLPPRAPRLSGEGTGQEVGLGSPLGGSGSLLGVVVPCSVYVPEGHGRHGVFAVWPRPALTGCDLGSWLGCCAGRLSPALLTEVDRPGTGAAQWLHGKNSQGLQALCRAGVGAPRDRFSPKRRITRALPSRRQEGEQVNATVCAGGFS